MRIVKTVVAAVLLVGISSSAFALSKGLHINTPKDDPACLVYEGGQICN
ncbi:hypothetical protein [Herbaspirillum huttiense]|uniref:Uncharacterized protein n=1 Tax=Herbaspirillum huttiense subsp. lycopersici TaxID=3074428 RepID=A0ABU2EUI4_9BURK|nr:hypothetical protein [Herbaspirillum huttiense]MDR9851836.1 hypothetical protein [Herbaspirillum huttiense SE1]